MKAHAAKVAEKLSEELGFDGDAHCYLMSVYKNISLSHEMRIDAAGKAIKYEKPALSTVNNKLQNADGTPLFPTKIVVQDHDGTESYS